MKNIEYTIESIKDSADRLYAMLGINADPGAALASNISSDADRLLSEVNDLTDELERAQARIYDLECKLDALGEELAKRPVAGRKRVYNDEQRAAIAAYRWSDGHTYKDTLAHFGISPDTLNHILREQR